MVHYVVLLWIGGCVMPVVGVKWYLCYNEQLLEFGDCLNQWPGYWNIPCLMSFSIFLWHTPSPPAKRWFFGDWWRAAGGDRELWGRGNSTRGQLAAPSEQLEGVCGQI